jgi:diacylglycerol kinase
MQEPFQKPERSWLRKFADAERGVVVGVSGERSFTVHLALAGAVVLAAAVLRVSLVEWGLLALAIAMVLGAELFNCALERLARAVTEESNEYVRDALDLAAGAVLMLALGAAATGLLVFLPRLLSAISQQN